jgi:hypothetical protein
MTVTGARAVAVNLNALGQSKSTTNKPSRGLSCNTAVFIGALSFLVTSIVIWAVYLKRKQRRRRQLEKAQQEDLERKLSYDSITKSLIAEESLSDEKAQQESLERKISNKYISRPSFANEKQPSGETVYTPNAPLKMQVERRCMCGMSGCKLTQMVDIEVPEKTVPALLPADMVMADGGWWNSPRCI